MVFVYRLYKDCPCDSRPVLVHPPQFQFKGRNVCCLTITENFATDRPLQEARQRLCGFTSDCEHRREGTTQKDKTAHKDHKRRQHPGKSATGQWTLIDHLLLSANCRLLLKTTGCARHREPKQLSDGRRAYRGRRCACAQGEAAPGPASVQSLTHLHHSHSDAGHRHTTSKQA